MTHAAALTAHAVELLDGPHQAKRIAALIAGSYRTVQDWRAQRRRMCLDHAVELAARNDEFRAALMARIEHARDANEASRRSAAAVDGTRPAPNDRLVDGSGAADRERGATAARATGRVKGAR